MARRLDHEALEISGNSPYVLKRLALINIVKGKTEAAQVFLNALSKDLIFGSWAQDYLKELEADPQQENNDFIQRLRSITSQKDNTGIAIKADDFFTQLLYKNPRNKMAFEYMTAYFLMTRQIHKIAANLGTYKYLGYEKIPRHVEEAVVIYLIAGGKVDNFHGYTISKTTLEKTQTFDRLFVQYGGKQNRDAAKVKLEKDYLGTYVFYYVFGVSKAVQ
jgi:hypothetical protein